MKLYGSIQHLGSGKKERERDSSSFSQMCEWLPRQQSVAADCLAVSADCHCPEGRTFDICYNEFHH